LAQWHGPTRDCRVPETARVPNLLPQRAETPLENPASAADNLLPVIAGGKLICLDENGRDEVVHCLDAGTGRELWLAPLAAAHEDEWARVAQHAFNRWRSRLRAILQRRIPLPQPRGWQSDLEPVSKRISAVNSSAPKSNEGVAAPRNNGFPAVGGRART